jgi:hypothetical protein
MTKSVYRLPPRPPQELLDNVTDFDVIVDLRNALRRNPYAIGLWVALTHWESEAKHA